MQGSMEKAPKTRTEIERLVLRELQACDRCEGAAAVSVVAWDDGLDGSNWTLSTFNIGTAREYDCELALLEIIPRFQSFYELVNKH